MSIDAEPPWAIEYKEQLPEGLDLSRPYYFIRCKVDLTDLPPLTNCMKANASEREPLVGISLRRRRPWWWPFGRKWIADYYFQETTES